MLRRVIHWATLAAITFASSAQSSKPQNTQIISRQCAVYDLKLFSEIEIARDSRMPARAIIVANELLQQGRKLCLAREDEKAFKKYQAGLAVLNDLDIVNRAIGD